MICVQRKETSSPCTTQLSRNYCRTLIKYANLEQGTLEDGTEFDSSIPRGSPFEFTLGTGQVIKGKRLTLCVPPLLVVHSQVGTKAYSSECKINAV